MAEGQIERWRLKDNTNVIVDAVRLNEDNAAEVAAWSGAGLVEEIDPEHPEEMQPGLNVTTPQGVERASLHMYVVKFGKSFWAVNNRVFETKYEPINREATPLESAGDTRKRLGFADPFDTGRSPL